MDSSATITKIYLLPVAVFCLVFGGFFISTKHFQFSLCNFCLTAFRYGIAVWQGHVLALFPYISDTGTVPPESCVFGQFVNIAAFLMLIVVYLRHRQTVEFYRQVVKKRRKWARRLSSLALALGIISSLGASIIANFQETSFFQMHMIGALMAFYIGYLYTWFQTFFTFYMQHVLASRWIAYTRVVLLVGETLSMAALMATGFTRPANYGKDESRKNFTRIEHAEHSRYPVVFYPDEYYYTEHLISAFAEWILVACFMAYILSYAVELRHACVTPPRLLLDVDALSVHFLSGGKNSRKKIVRQKTEQIRTIAATITGGELNPNYGSCTPESTRPIVATCILRTESTITYETDDTVSTQKA